MAALRTVYVFGLTVLLVFNAEVNCVSDEVSDEPFEPHTSMCSIDAPIPVVSTGQPGEQRHNAFHALTYASGVAISSGIFYSRVDPRRRAPLHIFGFIIPKPAVPYHTFADRTDAYCTEWLPNSKLASEARKAANELKRRVNCNLPLYYRDEKGTNYVASDVASFTEELAARFWYEGHTDYDFQEGGPDNRNPNVLSFTQLVWKSSKDVGCGVACCGEKQLILVCRFHPAGNIQGYYTQNVLEKLAQFDRLKGVTSGENVEL